MVQTLNAPIYRTTTETNIAPVSLELLYLFENTPITGSDYVLNHGLMTEVEVFKDGVIIRCNYIDEESYGKRPDIAYNDFITSIRDRYNSLNRRKNRLSQHDQSILERLQVLLGQK